MNTYYIHEVQDTCGVSYVVSPVINPVYGTEFKWDSFVVEVVFAKTIKGAYAKARKHYHNVVATNNQGLFV